MTEVFKNAETGHVEQWTAAAEGREVDWPALFAGYRATVDWPGAARWRELSEAFPDAKVILSLRDADRWYQSVMKTIWPSGSALLSATEERMASIGRMHDGLIWKGTFQGRIEDPDYAKHVFEEHNAEVKRSIPSERLLVYEPGDGWEPLCTFLGVDVPEEPYPHANSSENFERDIAEATKV
jgi:hypothetical protein